MKRVRRSGTRPELVVRKVCTSIGLRYRVTNRDLPGSPDLANRRRKLAIFVHGCFWHRHEGCSRATTPRSNRLFWLRKFRDNMARDGRAVRKLRAMNFRVMTIWECQVDDTGALTRRLRRFLA